MYFAIIIIDNSYRFIVVLKIKSFIDWQEIYIRRYSHSLDWRIELEYETQSTLYIKWAHAIMQTQRVQAHVHSIPLCTVVRWARPDV